MNHHLKIKQLSGNDSSGNCSEDILKTLEEDFSGGTHQVVLFKEQDDNEEEGDTVSENDASPIKWKPAFADTVSEPRYPTEFKWEIKNFSALPKDTDTFYESPEFNSPGFSWCLRLYPNGVSYLLTEGWIGIYLKMCKGCFVCIDYMVGIENINGAKKFANGFFDIFFEENKVKGWGNFLPMKTLIQRKCEFYPSDTLTIAVKLRHEIPELRKSKHCLNFFPYKIFNADNYFEYNL